MRDPFGQEFTGGEAEQFHVRRAYNGRWIARAQRGVSPGDGGDFWAIEREGDTPIGAMVALMDVLVGTGLSPG